ncbi:uncharacterized protein LOC129808469 [Phlebotomus papatasi]|uniref:uncharacterized protein LOC129808469 n=1 Tax=Phlebotomus papatasi TaxID=29031 RepID=UPI002483F53F|nr:uncharacterized protein LOC129808469 [Phlebotomus papatasi]
MAHGMKDVSLPQEKEENDDVESSSVKKALYEAVQQEQKDYVEYFEKVLTYVTSMVTMAEIDTNLRRFWEMDTQPLERQLTDDFCEKHFRKTFTRNWDGRYVVALPFKEENPVLGDSRPKEGQGKYYLPHHAVKKEDSTTTKTQVVFDGSCKTTNGKSLNDLLCVGPKLQEDLTKILTRWRKYKVAFTADIEKMFRQILVREEDRDYQRILWRFNESEPVQEYVLNTVTYGTAAATYLSVRALHQLAEDEVVLIRWKKQLKQGYS